MHRLSQAEARRIAVRAQASVVRVHAIHEDVKFTRPMTKAVRAEIADLASWLELEVETKHLKEVAR